MEQEANLKQRLTDDLKLAMKGGDTLKRATLRLLLSSIKNVEIAKQATMDDADIFGVIAKEARQRRESIEAFKQGERPDLVAQEEAELAVLNEYLPRQMSREEILTAARGVIAEVGAQGPGDKGRVMPRLIAQLRERRMGGR